MAKVDQNNQKGNVMIVDDVPINLHLLGQILIRDGYRVHAFPSGDLALAAAQASPPDLILLDVMMPVMSGYELCRHLKEDPSTHDIPVIFVSALGGASDKIDAFAAGGVDYVTKPFRASEVLARVETHLALHRLQQQLASQNAELHHYNTRLETMHEIDRAILAAESSIFIANAIVGRLRQLIPCQRAAVLAYDSDDQIELLAAESSDSLPAGIDTGICNTLVRDNPEQLHSVEDLDAQTLRTPAQEALFTQGVRAYVIVPMSAHEEIIGALYMDSDTPHPFTTDHIHSAQEVALLMALAIRQARLYEQAQQELEARKQAEAALREYAKELEASNAELDAFAHTVAHDLKNPLTTLIMYTSTVETRFESLQPAQRQAYLAAITQSSYRINSIVQELLLLANIRKVGDVRIEELYMDAIVMQAQARLVQLIQEFDAVIITPPTWPRALGRAQWVEEIWTNYISNAIKYGGRPPRVELGWSEVEETDHVRAYRFWVRDNGVGVSQEDQAQLFMPFTRLSQVNTEGHGLGLSIVQRIAERLGGQVGLESAPDAGSTFWFTLRAVPAHPTSQNPKQENK